MSQVFKPNKFNLFRGESVKWKKNGKSAEKNPIACPGVNYVNIFKMPASILFKPGSNGYEP
jgi:hypothetical protein